MKKIILAAGGTGGHLFPAVALSEELTKKNIDTLLITDKRHADLAIKSGLKIKIISSASSSGGIIKKAKSVLIILKGIIEARAIIKKEKADAVIGFGGYPSLPTMIAALTLGKKTIIHEQNSVLGRTNRLLAQFVDKIATSFPTTMYTEKYSAKTISTGNPVRASVAKVREMPYQKPDNDSKFNILITGGSQGAKIFGTLITNAILAIDKKYHPKIKVIQQCREEDIAQVNDDYKKAGVEADVAPFFSDMPKRLAEAHLVIARAGASTISELTVTGRPSILIPLPSAMDDHQTINALSLEERAACFLLKQTDATPETLAKMITDYIKKPSLLEKQAIRAFELGEEHAAKKLLDVVVG